MENQFEKVYKIQPQFEENPGNLKKQRFIEDQQKRIQHDLPLRPPNITYFEQILYRRDIPRTNVPRVGYFCNMIPAEIIWALGAHPIRLDCGNNAAALVGEEVLSGDICPLAKSSFGMFLNEHSLANSCDVLLLPTSCDAKRKMGEVLNDIKPVFMFNLPPEQNHQRYSQQSYQECLRMVKFLEQHLKTRLTGRALRKAVRLSQQKVMLIRELQSLRIQDPRPLSVRDYFLIIQSSFLRPVDLESWITEIKKVIDYVRAYTPQRHNLRPKMILTGAPVMWPNFKVLNVLEESGADIIADTLCTGGQSCYDPVMADEWGKKPLLRALANRYVFASICPCFVSQTTRLNRIIDLFEETKADGVVNYSLRLCQLFDIETYRVERTMKERKVPFINVRTDYSLEDTEQLRIRIEAFLETL